ncbi:MAG: hypothetical protein MJK18_12225, partial [Bdellovibrionales bacterium]|nr:hypothetical protein [Bdellovibrionales bacterium]
MIKMGKVGETLNLKLISAKVLLVFAIVLLASNKSYAVVAQEASATLIESFLEATKNESIGYFNANMENHQAILQCLNSASRCDVEIETDLNGHEAVLEFGQNDLIQYMSDRYQEYRFIVGLAYYPVINPIISGSRRMSITPLQTAGAVIFETRSEEGRAEWDMISRFYQREEAALNFHNEWMIRNDFSFDGSNVGYKESHEFFKNQISIYLQKFPFSSSP